MLFPPLNNIPSLGPQFSTPADHSLSQALLSLPESSNGLPELPGGQPSFSLASENSSPLVFASATTAAALLVSLFLLPQEATGFL